MNDKPSVEFLSDGSNFEECIRFINGYGFNASDQGGIAWGFDDDSPTDGGYAEPGHTIYEINGQLFTKRTDPRRLSDIYHMV